MSMRPCAASTSRTVAVTWPGSPILQPCAEARPPAARISPATDSQASVLRLATATVAPWRASSMAMARPIPRLPPVTSATRPLRSNGSSAKSVSPRRRPGSVAILAPHHAANDRYNRRFPAPAPRVASMLIPRRDLDFQLFDVLHVDDLCGRDRFREHDRAVFDGVIDTAYRIAAERFAPFAAACDIDEPRMVDGRAWTIPETRAALTAYNESSFKAATFDAAYGGQQ